MTKTLPVDDGGHSKLAPSSASRWTVCTASPAFIEANQHRIPKDNGSTYANEGTLAHDWAKRILLGESEITDLPEDLVEPVGFYVKHCGAISKQGGTQFVERQVPLFYRPEDNGTVDFALLTSKALRFRDYKHGEGVTVEAKGNKQLAIYAFSLITDLEEMGLWEFPDDMLVDMGIVQPRCREGEPIKLWAITVKELRDFCIEIRTAANLIRYAEEGMTGAEGKLHFVPVEGDAGSCRWCPAKGFCKARAEKLQEPIPFDVVGAFEDLDEGQTIRKDKAPAPEQLTDEEIAALVLATPDLVKWLNDVKEYAQNAISSGQGIAGLKVVAGRQGNRAWSDEEAAGKLIAKFIPANDRFTKKLISVAQAEKLLKPHEGELSTRFKNRFDELVTRSDGKPTLVSENDPRESIYQPAEETFEDLDAADEPDPLA